LPTVKSTSASTARRKKLTRAEKGAQIRASLFEAAFKVVGREGYANAMISMITSEAGVSQGTFYNYFESRQELFDELLPKLGEEMLNFIREETEGSTNAIEREERSFRAFFTFLKVRPEFYRILYEAELLAPTAFERHTKIIADGYVRVLERAQKGGELQVDDPKELEAIAFMLMGVRHYLCMRFARSEGETISLPEWVVRIYMRLAKNGVFADKSRPAK
jgi:AcrR family transcriptional regulator